MSNKITNHTHHKKLLLQMKKEIKNLEHELKYFKLINLKICTIKNLKISTKTIQRIAPYILTATLIAEGFKYTGLGLPFIKDNFKNNLNIMKEFDNLGNYSYQQQYDNYINSNNYLYHYSKWQQEENGTYSRFVETYKLGELTESYIIELINKTDLNLSDVLGKPISKKKETNNTISKEELQQKEYLKVIMYNEEKNDYIIKQETISENIMITASYLLITALAETTILCIRHEVSDFDYYYSVDEIKRKHAPLDLKILKKKLEIRQNNYNRLKR